MVAARADAVEPDEQDQAEVFDESKVDDSAEFVTLEEMPDVYDATSALGDSREMQALDADELDPDALADEDIEDDEDVNDTLDDDLEDEVDDDLQDEDDVDDEDAVDALAWDEAEVEVVADVDDVTDLEEDEADELESEELSDGDLQDLGYEERQPPRAKAPPRHPDELPTEVHPHQDELLDEGVEETFPASDPVSVKHIT